MIPWVLIDTAPVPGGRNNLHLMRRGTEFSIMWGQNQLMSSRLTGSEEALAAIACKKIEATERPALLIGGLGMGFTLRAALAVLGPEARIVVAELMPAVVEWARGAMAGIFGESLADPRIIVREADVIDLIQSSPSTFDAILLDVDNGPAGLTRDTNNRLYHLNGLADAYAALRPGGALAVWSSESDQNFTNRLRKTGFLVEEVRVRSNAGRGARHVIWIASRPQADTSRA